jgi:hypothetical protein
MIAQGFGIAAKLKDAGIEFGRSGMEVTSEYAKANPNTVLVAVASVLEAQNTIWTDPATVVPKYMAFTTLDEAAATKQVENFATVGNRSLQWTDEALINAQKPIAVVNPDIIDVKISDAGDPSYLQTLEDNGFYEKIGPRSDSCGRRQALRRPSATRGRQPRPARSSRSGPRHPPPGNDGQAEWSRSPRPVSTAAEIDRGRRRSPASNTKLRRHPLHDVGILVMEARGSRTLRSSMRWP